MFKILKLYYLQRMVWNQ